MPKFKTGVFTLALAVCLIFSLCTVTAFAAEAPEQPSASGEAPYGVTYLWETVETAEGGVRARLNWMTDTGIAESWLFYAKKSDFESNGHIFTDVVEGTSRKIDLSTQLAALGYKGGTGTYDGSGSYCYMPVQSHKAETGPLEPGTEYVYCVGDGGENTTSVSEPRSFITPAAELDSFDMLFFSDAQQGGGGYEDTREGYEALNKALTQATQDFPNAAFIMSGGDQVNFGFDTWAWDCLFDVNQKIFDRYPLYLATGNHECGGDSNGLGWVNPDLSGEPVDSTASALMGRFNPPQNGAAYYGAGATGDEPLVTGHAQMEAMAGNYYFIYGNTLFMVIDYQDHTDTALVEAEQEWVKAVVKNHPEVQWRIAVMHESMFGYRVQDPTTGLNRAWTDTFDAAGVDVVLMGHDHIYTRTKYYSGAGLSEPQEPGAGTVYVTAASANTDNRSYYYEDNPYIEVHSEGGYGRAYVALSISDTEIRLTTKGFDTEQDDSLVTLEDNALLTSKPRTPDLESYSFPEAPAAAEKTPLENVELNGRAKVGLTVQAAVAPPRRSGTGSVAGCGRCRGAVDGYSQCGYGDLYLPGRGCRTLSARGCHRYRLL